MSQRTIPVVDLQKFTKGTDTERREFIRELGDAFHNIGFVAVKNHGVSMSLIKEFYDQSKIFFSLDEDTKRKYEVEGLAGQRGYTSFGKEHAKDSEVPDLKEFFQVGPALNGDLLEFNYPENVQVSEVPEFAIKGDQLFQEFLKAGGQLLRAIALHLELDENYFERYIKHGSSILRAIHYPPITKEPDSAIRAEQHEDINLITLLVGASAGGLQVLSKDNEWLSVMPEDNEIVINVGDMLQRLTNNYFKSTTHRVVNPPKSEWDKPRLSIPFFLHPIPKMDLSCLPQCVAKGEKPDYQSITAGEYLNQRLEEIGLKN